MAGTRMDGHLYLIGFMGAGKTTVGRLLAQRLGLPFHDLDQAVARITGRTISEIFEAKGESHFRDLEYRTLRGLSPPSVIALGGGAFHTPRLRDHVRETGRSLFLDWPWEALYQRIADDPDRPLARDRAFLSDLFENRYPLYRTADLVWRSQPPHGETPEQVTEDLLELLGRSDA